MRDRMELDGKRLDSFSISDLAELRSKAQELIEVKNQEEEAKYLESIAEIIREHKIPYAKVMRVLREENAIIAPLDSEGYACPIYYNPKNPTEVYDGQGRRPNWVKKLLDSNKNLSDFIINKDANFNPKQE